MPSNLPYHTPLHKSTLLIGGRCRFVYSCIDFVEYKPGMLVAQAPLARRYAPACLASLPHTLATQPRTLATLGRSAAPLERSVVRSGGELNFKTRTLLHFFAYSFRNPEFSLGSNIREDIIFRNFLEPSIGVCLVLSSHEMAYPRLGHPTV